MLVVFNFNFFIRITSFFLILVSKIIWQHVSNSWKDRFLIKINYCYYKNTTSEIHWQKMFWQICERMHTFINFQMLKFKKVHIYWQFEKVFSVSDERNKCLIWVRQKVNVLDKIWVTYIFRWHWDFKFKNLASIGQQTPTSNNYFCFSRYSTYFFSCMLLKIIFQKKKINK